jgi:hypothetical protein
MSKLSFVAVGLLAACLALAAPSVSHAGPRHFDHRGHRHYDYGYRGYGYGGYGRYSGYRGYGWGGYDYGYRYRRPAIVHPEYLHWTPYRGWHTHGHIHVPHRGHYHTYDY